MFFTSQETADTLAKLREQIEDEHFIIVDLSDEVGQAAFELNYIDREVSDTPEKIGMVTGNHGGWIGVHLSSAGFSGFKDDAHDAMLWLMMAEVGHMIGVALDGLF